jgi:hypothetical protein
MSSFTPSKVAQGHMGDAVQALDAGLGQTELLQQQVQRSGLLSSESMKDRIGESMVNASDVSFIGCLHDTNLPATWSANNFSLQW